MKLSKVKKDFVNRWYETIDSYGGEDFLDFAEHSDINSFVIDKGVRKVLFEDGVYTYSVAEEMCETDGEKEKAIIDMLEECGVEFRELSELNEPKSFIETGACGTYYDWGVEND